MFEAQVRHRESFVEESHVCHSINSMLAERGFPSRGLTIEQATFRQQQLAWVFTWSQRDCDTLICAMTVQSCDASCNPGCAIHWRGQWRAKSPPLPHHLTKGTFCCHSALTDGPVVSFLGLTVASVRGVERCQQVFRWCARVASDNASTSWETSSHCGEARLLASIDVVG